MSALITRRSLLLSAGAVAGAGLIGLSSRPALAQDGPKKGGTGDGARAVERWWFAA